MGRGGPRGGQQAQAARHHDDAHPPSDGPACWPGASTAHRSRPRTAGPCASRTPPGCGATRGEVAARVTVGDGQLQVRRVGRHPAGDGGRGGAREHAGLRAARPGSPRSSDSAAGSSPAHNGGRSPGAAPSASARSSGSVSASGRSTMPSTAIVHPGSARRHGRLQVHRGAGPAPGAAPAVDRRSARATREARPGRPPVDGPSEIWVATTSPGATPNDRPSAWSPSSSASVTP